MSTRCINDYDIKFFFMLSSLMSYSLFNPGNKYLGEREGLNIGRYEYRGSNNYDANHRTETMSNSQFIGPTFVFVRIYAIKM